MIKPVIAIICDFDETLGPDTISFLLEKNSISYNTFWPKVYAMVKESWDPPMAYMHLLLEYAKKGKLDLSQKSLQALGKQLALFPGLPNAFVELKEFVKTEPLLRQTGVKLEFYIVSGGMEDMIMGSSLAEHVDGVFGSAFAYDTKTKAAVGIRTAISFTEKTRYIFGINKGVSVKELRTEPYSINKVRAFEKRRIPFAQMIYIGDGPSDIPSLSVIAQYGGTGIGVSAPHMSFKKGYELARGKRITVGPYTANYKAGSDMRKILEATIMKMGFEIAENKKKRPIVD